MAGMTNQELLQKATITTEALADAGKLNPEQADRFLDYVIDETQLGGMGVRFERFRNEKMLLEKLNVANRVAVPADEAADPGIRRGVTSSKVELAPKEIMVPFEIGDLFQMHSIEGDNVEEHIIQMMARRFANNIEELYWDGNALGPAILGSEWVAGGGSGYRKDTYLGLFDGLLKLAEGGNVVDAANADISPRLISRALRAMPNKFRKNRRDLWGFMSWDHEQHYREGVSTRATGAGDSALAGTETIPSFGVNLGPISLLDPNPQYVEHIVLNGTTPTALTHGPVTDVVVTSSTLGKPEEPAFAETTDYVVDAAAGTLARNGAGSIGDGATVKVTYRSAGRMVLTRPKNIIIAIGKDITIERDRNIYRRVNEFAIHAKVFCTYEELDAVVLLKNIAVPTE